MMSGILENIVRPWVAPSTISTKRIIKSVEDDTAAAPTITWGQLGTLAEASKQPPDGIGFQVNCCDDTWIQKGAPITEDVEIPIKDKNGKQIGTVVVKRVKQVKMKDSKKGGCEDSQESISYVASAVKTSLDEFTSSANLAKTCNATYKYNWN